MIELTRLNGSKIFINEDLIETVEETPDTVITFFSGRKLVIRESMDEIIENIRGFRESLRRT